MVKHKPRSKSTIISMVCLLGILFVFIFAANRPAYAATLNKISPNSGYWGQLVFLYGSGFDDEYVDEDTTYVEFISVTGTEREKATIHYPVGENWTDTRIVAEVPAGLPAGLYNITVTSSSGLSSPQEFNVTEYSTPQNMIGTPDNTTDYIISNTQSINVSDAVRRLTQGFLLPSKETIIEIGRYIEDSLTLKMNLGGDTEADQEGSAYNTLLKIWSFSRALTNSLFLVALIATGFMIMFRLNTKAYNYSFRNLMPRIILAALLVQVSFFLSKTILDIVLILTHVMLDQLSLPPNPTVPQPLATALFGELRLNIFVLSMLAFYLLIMALLSAILILLILRTVAIWMMIAISPLIFMTLVLPNTGHIPLTWFKRYVQLLIMGPIAAFLLYIGTVFSQSIINDFENADLIRAFIGTATAACMIAMPFVMNSAVAFVSDMVSSKEKTSSTKTATKTTTASKESTLQEKMESVEGARQKIELHDIDSTKIQTTQIPLTAELQSKFQQLLGKADGGDETGAISVQAVQPAGPAPTGQGGTPASIEPDAGEQAPAESRIIRPGQAIKIPEKELAGMRPGGTSTRVQSSSKLFDTAPKQLIVSWLQDNNKRQIVSAGIVAKQGDVENEKAVAIFDSQKGKQMLNDMYVEGNNDEKNASSTMIGNVMLAYPDRMQQVVTQATSSPPPIQEAARNILEAGIVKLGQRIMANPEDEKLQKAAERMVMYAPHLLTDALYKRTNEGAGFIQLGIDQVAGSIGEDANMMTRMEPMATLLTADTEQGQAYRDLSNVAAQTMLYPQMDLSQIGHDANERAFITAGLLSDSEDQPRP